jgi:hypothetical protein
MPHIADVLGKSEQPVLVDQGPRRTAGAKPMAIAPLSVDGSPRFS